MTTAVNEEAAMARTPSNPLIEEQIMDQAFSELAALLDESEGLLNGGRGRRYRRRVQRQLDQVLQRAGALTGQLSERAAPVVQGTEAYVRKNPYRAVGLAAAAGLLAAWVINRR
jgi:ElaB/YqjD/DUF883 family membrane-anchored ribosome-binding protein